MSYPRVEYEMSKKDLTALLDACRPVPVMMIGSYVPSSPQENANLAWADLGKKMGFDSTTVRPIPGKEMRFFSAVPSETEEQKAERIKKERREKRTLEIVKLQSEIGKAKTELERLLAEDDEL